MCGWGVWFNELIYLNIWVFIMKKFLLSMFVFAAAVGHGAPVAERLNRGAVAMKSGTGVVVTWRWLTRDGDGVAFDVVRDGVRVNRVPVTESTCFFDAAGTVDSRYEVVTLRDGAETERTDAGAVIADAFRRIPLERPADGVSAAGGSNQMSADPFTYSYTPNDCSVGDVDGDGEYEIFVKWDPSNSADNSLRRNTGNVFIDCYKLDGRKLWRVDLGRNIRAGAHYTQFMVFDFDGDGRAEMMCKTAPGTVDGQGKAVLMGADRADADYRVKSGSNTGIIMSGPEYLTVFDGETGAEIHSIAYNPPRSKHSSWGDSYGNRSERYLACVAYLDGEKPSAVFCRGYYTQSYLWAVDFDGEKLSERWLYGAPTSGQGAYGEGAHSVTVGDVDGDGCDEIVYGSASIDHDGKLLYRTGFGHGDALHLGDFDPDREGLEVFMVHEEKGAAFPWDAECRDARTGKVIWGVPQSGNDIGRGLVGNLSSAWRGYEMWPGSRYVNGTRVNATFDCKGNVAADGKVPSSNFRVYWDGDLLDELFDGRLDSSTGLASPSVTKRNEQLTGDAKTWPLTASRAQSCNWTKATPCLQADLYGDWREEIVLWDGTNSSDLLVFGSKELTGYRVPCLMEDHNYRLAVAWQNSGYNQPPHLGYYLEGRYGERPRVWAKSGELYQELALKGLMGGVSGVWEYADGVEAVGLPDGVKLTQTKSTRTWSLSGRPTVEGVFDFAVRSVGGSGDAYELRGQLRVGDESGLSDVEVASVGGFELVSVASGRCVMRGRVVPENLGEGVEPGVYVLVVWRNGVREVRKVVI